MRLNLKKGGCETLQITKLEREESGRGGLKMGGYVSG
jgi:hypothetical protein